MGHVAMRMTAQGQEVPGRPATLWTDIGILGLAFLLWPSPATAVQIHGAPEGLYVHQMAHLFFVGAIVTLLGILHRHPVGKGRGWAYLKGSLVFFLLWNLDTFAVHWGFLKLPPEVLKTTGGLVQHQLAGPLSFPRYSFYFGTFDHLLCVPAMLLFVLSLRHFFLEASNRVKSNKGAPR